MAGESLNEHMFDILMEAIAIEDRAQSCLARALSSTDNQELRNVFRKLLREAEKHEGILKETMREYVGIELDARHI